MSREKRRARRFRVPMSVSVSYPDGRSYRLRTRDISDHGVFLELAGNPPAPPGSELVLQVLSALEGEPPPPVRAAVVRCTDEGMALQFLSGPAQ